MQLRWWSGWRGAERFGARSVGVRTFLVLVAILASLLAMATPNVATAVESIAVVGNRRVDADAIRSHLHVPAGGTLDAAVRDKALKELYATGEFEDVKIVPSGAGLTVTVVEAPVIGKLQFEGNKALKDKDLAKEVQLKAHAPATKAAIQADVARIAEMYQHAGRYQAQITPNTIQHGDGRIDLVFEIREGDKTGVKRIVFIGNRAFPAQRLKSVVQTTESGWFAFLKTSDVYDPDRIELDGDLLRRFYLKNGYADARVVTAVGEFDPAQQGFTVSFTIDEGERYRFGKIDVESRVPAVDAAALRGALHLTAGAAYDGEAVDKAVDGLILAAGQRGYPFVLVRPRPTRDIIAGTVDLDFIVDDAPHVYIERIAVHGNTVTRDYVVRREFDIAEGDAYNRALIDRAERRLKALGLFKTVKIESQPGSVPDRVVLNVNVEEDRTGDLSFSGGYSTQDGVIGEISLSEKNFLGRGQYVKVSVALGQYMRSGSVSFVEPYLLGNRMSLGLDLFYKETITNTTQSYGSTSYGTGIKIDAPLMDGVTTEARYAIVNQSLTLDPSLMCNPATSPTPCASAAVQQAALNGPQWLSSVGSGVTYSTLDNAKNPHEGIKATMNQDIAGLGGDVDFLKTTGDVRYYHDLGNDVVGIVRGQGGYVAPYGGQTLPFQSGFFGGPQLVRGFAVNGFGPRDLTPNTTNDNLGGSAYWATSAELQAPIPGLPPEIALKAAGFADAGSLWGYRGATSFPALSQSLTTADSRQIRSSVGAGLIWDSPFGALRVDYAYPVSKQNYDVTQRLHFGVGGF